MVFCYFSFSETAFCHRLVLLAASLFGHATSFYTISKRMPNRLLSACKTPEEWNKIMFFYFWLPRNVVLRISIFSVALDTIFMSTSNSVFVQGPLTGRDRGYLSWTEQKYICSVQFVCLSFKAIRTATIGLELRMMLLFVPNCKTEISI